MDLMLVHMVPRSYTVQCTGRGGWDERPDGLLSDHDIAASAESRFRISCIVKQFMIAGIRFYQKFLSPLKTTKCPYIPTCSAYGLEAIQKYGAWKGGWMALWRIMRCNPFSHGGYDPVP